MSRRLKNFLMSYKLQAPSSKQQAPSMRQIVAGQNDSSNKLQAPSSRLQAPGCDVSRIARPKLL